MMKFVFTVELCEDRHLQKKTTHEKYRPIKACISFVVYIMLSCGSQQKREFLFVCAKLFKGFVGLGVSFETCYNVIVLLYA